MQCEQSAKALNYQMGDARVATQRRLANAVGTLAEPFLDFAVVDPHLSPVVQTGRGWLEEQNMPPVLERRHAVLECLPVVRDDDDPPSRPPGEDRP